MGDTTRGTRMAPTDKQKQSLYFSDDMLREIMMEATRLDRSLSWIVQQAWRVAREELQKFPSVSARGDADRDRRPEREEVRPSLELCRASAQVLEFVRGKFDSGMAS